ncbi:protein brambleberry-like isoform X3 [Rhineura floridana]|uniref:protein brambleberry-like isoform X3 n=1 Tax=Rhineura floridana TaxID=261503 RepID=UPI002AC81D97|nr:protein brambleberry-like isoform X3 [Rhineura floridana]
MPVYGSREAQERQDRLLQPVTSLAARNRKSVWCGLRFWSKGYPLKMLPLDHWVLILLLPLVLIVAPSSGFFGWLTQSRTPESQPESPTLAPDPRHLSHDVPFEMTTADESFLVEARQLDLSPLDSCHHKVIAQLRSSCTDLAEEELAKLGVSLFNCQASIEGRRTYLCTADMTLAECTAEMDPDTWNAYHIVSNRARAVCYATRQMQFKRQAEQTVNALVSTAINQLETMEMLKNGQEELKELTSESLQKVVNSQQELLAQQEKLQGSQEQMEEAIHGNLDQLAKEKALIASGHQQVAQLIEGITRRMENVSSHLDHQDMDLQEGHKAILMDLSQVQKRAQEVYSKIETNLGLFVAHQNQTALYYDELMAKLHRMNESLGLVLYAMDHMQSSVEGRLQHIQRFITWAGHCLLGSLCSCAPRGRRLKPALLPPSLLRERTGTGTHEAELKGSSCCCITSTPDREGNVGLLNGELEKLEEVSYMSDASHLERESPVKGKATLPEEDGPMQLLAGWKPQKGYSVHSMSLRRLSLTHSTRHEAPLERFAQQPVGSAFNSFPNLRACSPNESMVSDVSSCSMSPRPLCQGITRTGQQCRKKAIPRHVFCHVHASGQASYTSQSATCF